MKILIVEDDERVAEILSRSLQEEGYQTRWASDALQSLKLLQNEAIDLVITDIVMPGMNGLNLTRKLRAERPHIPILMLTALGTTDDKVEGFDAGADDYLVKPFELRELLARVKALLNRSTRMQQLPDVLRCNDLELHRRLRLVFRSGKEIRLTAKEFSLLQYFMENQGRIISKAELAEKVWGIRFDTGTNFVDVYVAYLRKKIDKDFARPLLETRPGMGYRLNCSDASKS